MRPQGAGARMVDGHGHVPVATHVLHRHPAGELLVEHRHGHDFHPQLQAVHQDLQQLAVHLVGDGQDEGGDVVLGDEGGEGVAITQYEQGCRGAGVQG
jgi:hypothetical protein